MSEFSSELISVVIPNYNGSDYLRACLDSVLAGSLVPKIIVVDNGSSDCSCEMVEKEYPQVLLLRLKANTGFCHAVNAGLHLVRTPYAMLLNNDTSVERDCLQKLLCAMEKRTSCFAVQARMLSMKEPDRIDDDGDLYNALGWAFARHKNAEKGKAAAAPLFAACAGAALYRMSVFEEIGWFDERHYCYLEDLDIGWRAQIFGHRSYLEPGAEVFHAGSATAGGKYSDFKEVMTAGNNALLQYKNMPFLQYWLNAPLRSLGTAVKKAYFTRKGLGDAYAEGIRRGEFLKASCAEYTECIRYGIPYKKCSIPQEAGFPEQKEDLMEVLPIYLGRKIPFEWRHFPHYLSIQGQLLAGLFRRRPSV